jgi:CubicO group peptidase (beta-lactamase class C family)
VSHVELPRTIAVVEEGIAAGQHLGAQGYVSRHGTCVAELVVGSSAPGVPMTRDTLMLWLSSSKPITAAAVLQQRERGKLDLNDPVTRHVPEFGQNGKQEVTLRHLLTHTGGFRWVDTGWPETTWDEIIARICAAPLEKAWTPGAKAGYHPYTSWYLLAEVIRRLDGRPLSQYVREEIFLPLAMTDCWIGMPSEKIAEYGSRIGSMPQTDKPGHPPHPWSTPEGITHGAPGGGGYGPMHQLARFYEMLLGDGEREGARILHPESVRLMTSRQRVGMFDETFRHVMDWGLGVIVDSKQYGAGTVPYGYGNAATALAFGHSGSQSSVAFADPPTGLVVTLVFVGMPGERPHQRRLRAALAALEEDLATR